MHVYSTKELRAKIRSNDYGAELCLQHAMANIESLEMQVEALRKDAERYRYLRDDFSPMGLNIDGDHAWAYRRNATLKGPNLDAAIDAAMQAR